ncbi:LIM-domain binding protein, partial [Infundibulicybe gibba]
GQGLYRLQQFSNALSSESKSKHALPWWNLLVQEYFMPDACMELSLPDDSSRSDPKIFHVEVPVLPRFFLSATQSGVRSMSLTLSEPSPRESITRPGRVSIDCPSAIWTFVFGDGCSTALCGPLTAEVII